MSYICEYCNNEHETNNEALQCCDVLRQEDEDHKNYEEWFPNNNVNSDMQETYKKWCKDTKRNGAVLIGGSMREFLTYLEQYYIIIKKKEDEKQTNL